MNDSRERLLPGTAMPYTEMDARAFSRIEMLISAAGGLSLSQVCAITGLEGTTIQNWVKRGWVSNPKGKKYDEAQVARILIINALKECVKLESISHLLRYISSLSAGGKGGTIKESDLFNFMCQALSTLRQAEDFSRGGVEAVADSVIRYYEGPTPYSRLKLRKALCVMIYACVCTDVKRRTESMLEELMTGSGESASEPVAEPVAEPAAVIEAIFKNEETESIPKRREEKKPVTAPTPRSLFFKRGS